jgi:hypothetical protein
MHWILKAMLIASLFGAWHWWSSERHVHVPSGVVAPAEPVQTLLVAREPFAARDHQFMPRARYEITARVLRKEIYRLDGGASLAPVDLAVGWGPMSDSTVVEQLDFSQMGRFFYWRPRDHTTFALTMAETVAHAAQIHAIPADAEVEARLRSLRPGHVVTLRGYLVDIRGARGFAWNTSLSRTDTGDGACEIMWIQDAVVER